MREFDPNDCPTITDTVRDSPNLDNRRTGMGTLGMLAVLAIILGLGLFAWNSMPNDRLANNATPGVTTGSSTTSAATVPTAPPLSRGNATYPLEDCKRPGGKYTPWLCMTGLGPFLCRQRGGVHVKTAHSSVRRKEIRSLIWSGSS